MTPEVQCYNDRLELSLFLQKKKLIPFNKLDKITSKVYYLNYENVLKGTLKRVQGFFHE